MNDLSNTDLGTSEPTVVTLSGSSPSTGEPPASLSVDTPPNAPVFRSSSERLADLVAEHRRLIDFYNAAQDADASSEFRAEEKGHATGCDWAFGLLEKCELMIEAIPSRTIGDLGLKARVLSWSRSDWWEESKTDESGARNLVDDILNLAGMDRLRRPDPSFSDLLPGYAGPPHYLKVETPAENAPPLALAQGLATTELEAMAADIHTVANVTSVTGSSTSTGSLPTFEPMTRDYPSTEPASVTADPVLLAIEKHRASHARAEERGISDRKRATRADVAAADMNELLGTTPTTLSGLRDFVAYIRSYLKGGDSEVAEWSLDTIHDACETLFGLVPLNEADMDKAA